MPMYEVAFDGRMLVEAESLEDACLKTMDEADEVAIFYMTPELADGENGEDGGSQ